MREKTTLTKVSSKGQIVIPKAFRKKLGFEKGKKVLIESSDRTLILRPMAKLSELKGSLKETLPKEKTADELVEEVRREWEEELELM